MNILKQTIYILLLATNILAQNTNKVDSIANITFSDYFENATLRFDYLHIGNKNNEKIIKHYYKHEPFWGGTKTKLTYNTDLGHYKVILKDSASNITIFKYSYSTMFNEWQTLDLAKHQERAFYESVIMPFPKSTAKISILRINNYQKWTSIYSEYLNPNDYFIKREKTNLYPVIQINGKHKPSKSLDIVIIPEGYTKLELEKFKQDAVRMTSYLLSTSPFKENSDKINVRLILAASKESKTDIPGEKIWKNTLLNTRFYTFDSERYLSTENIEKLRNVAAATYYDQIYILVNTDKYGGGGIYNFYNICTADNQYSKEVFTHELGHGIAWLADEYYYDNDDVNFFYNQKLEPREKNITTLANFDVKWKNKLDKLTQIPTTPSSDNINKIGVYEGAKYFSKGVFRAYQNCKMKSNNTDEFCDVCKDAIVDVINYYCN